MAATKEAPPNPVMEDATRALSTIDVTPPELVVIQTNVDYMEAASALRAIAGKLSSIEAARLSVTRPLDKLKNDAMAYFKPAQAALAAREVELRRAIVEWNTRQESIRRAEEARLRDEQARIEAAANEEALKLAAAGRKNAARAVIANIPPVPTAINSAPVRAPGIGNTKHWKFKVEDIFELMLHVANNPECEYIIPNDKLLGELARSTKGKVSIPGVRFYAEDGLIVKS